MPEIITRAEAKALGLKRYFTGVPCKHGHVSYRYVSGPGCLGCVRENLPEISCAVCDSIFKPRTWRVVCCSANCQKDREREANKRWRHERKEIQCRECLNVFKNRGRKLRFYCSDKCRKAAKKKLKAAQHQRWVARKGKVKRRGICVTCGAAFTPRNSRVKACSKLCSKKRYADLKKIWVASNRERVNSAARALTAKKDRKEYLQHRKELHKKNRDRINERKRKWYRSGPINPKGEKQWLTKARAQLRSVKRFLKNLDREQSPSSHPET
jgi:hypothetical protein